MGIVQMRNSDGVYGDRINITTHEYFEKYDKDESVRKRIDYFQYQVRGDKILVSHRSSSLMAASLRLKRSSFSHKFALFILDW